MTDQERKELCATIISDVEREYNDLKNCKLNFKDIPQVFKVVGTVIHCIEDQAERLNLPGEEKRAIAVDIINAFLDIPMIPEPGEAFLIGLCVDAAVSLFNRYIWKKPNTI